MIISNYFDEQTGFGIDRPHGHPDWEWLLLYTINGGGILYAEDDVIRTVNAGDMVLLRTSSRHGYHTAPDAETWKFMWVHYNHVPQNSYFSQEQLLICSVQANHRRRQIYRAFKNIIYHTRDLTPLWRELCEAIIAELLLMLAEQQSKGVDPRIEQIHRFLAVRMKEKVKLEHIADRIGLSVSRLSHLYKQETGRTILSVLAEMRLRQAALLLEYSGRTASEIAFEVGFQDYNNFALQFRRQYQMSPREYMAQKRRLSN